MSCQIGIYSYFNPDLPPKRALELIVQTGFRVISVWGADRPGIGPMLELHKQLIRAARDDYGLVLESLHAPYKLTPDLFSSDESLRRQAVDRLRQAITDAHELNIPVVVVHTHRARTPDSDSPQARQSFTELVDALAGSDVRLAVENTMGNFALFEWLLEQFPAEQLGFCYDSSHDRLVSKQSFDLLRRWGHRLLTTHISDNHGIKDDHIIPWEGVIDWSAFVQAFPWNTYTGYLTLEVAMAKSSFTDSAEFLAQAYAAGQRLLALADQT